jgi:hypothetical protein
MSSTNFYWWVCGLSLVMDGSGPGHVDDGKSNDNEHEKAKVSRRKKIP